MDCFVTALLAMTLFLLLHILPSVYKFKHELLNIAEPFFLELTGFYSYVAEVPAFPAITGDIFVALWEAKAPAVVLRMCIEPFTTVCQSI